MAAPTTRQRRVRPLSHPVQWFAPQPLWRVLPRDASFALRRSQPTILRFATDSFMEELLALLASATPGNLATYVARSETWREPRVGLDADGRDADQTLLKLYQPSQNRFYLVAGALACAIPGVPDRTINAAAGESVFFVLRQQRADPENSSKTIEYGWSTGSGGGAATASTALAAQLAGCQPAGQKGWVALADPEHAVLCDEERFPLFPIAFQQDGVTRRLLAGMVPVASRETYAAGGTLSPTPSIEQFALPGGDPRPILFQQQVTGALASLQEWYAALTKTGGPGVTAADQRQIERTTVFILLDLMQSLKLHVPALYNSIMGLSTDIPGEALGLALMIYYTWADNQSLWDVLATLEEDRAAIEALGPDDELEPEWVFPWVGPDRDFSWWLEPDEGEITVPQPDGTERVDPISGALVQVQFQLALAQPYAPADPAAGYGEMPKLDPQGGERFVIRMVYDRPACPLPIVSAASRPFTLAGFFDPDAPVRPIRITMPVDTSPEGLRKFDKGVSFMLSNQLRAQMGRISDLKALMDGDVGPEGSFDLGLICSFSIPIITIVALILLMIFVQLLNIIFWWLPFFKICLPLNLRR